MNNTEKNFKRDSNGWIDPATPPRCLPGVFESDTVLILLQYPGYTARTTGVNYRRPDNKNEWKWAGSLVISGVETSPFNDVEKVIGWQPLPAEALGEPVPQSYTRKEIVECMKTELREAYGDLKTPWPVADPEDNADVSGYTVMGILYAALERIPA